MSAQTNLNFFTRLIEKINKFFSWLGKQGTNVGTIALIAIVCFVIAALTIVLGSRDYVINHWEQFRCDPFYSTFASFYGKDATKNAEICGQSGFGSLLGGKLGPLGEVSSMINSTMGDLGSIFSDMGNFGLDIFGVVFGFIKKFQEMIANLLGILLFLGMKMKSILGKIYGTFVAVLYAMYAQSMLFLSVGDGIGGAVDTVAGSAEGGGGSSDGDKSWTSMWLKFMGPEGGGGFDQRQLAKMKNAGSMDQACCFLLDTPIVMNDNTTKNIQDIKIGDVVESGGKVLGTYQLLSNNKLWKIIDKKNGGQTVVSDTHLVYFKGHDEFQEQEYRVRDLVQLYRDGGDRFSNFEFIPVNSSLPHHTEILYCLLTENHTIRIANVDIMFADFLEYSEGGYINLLKTQVNRFYNIPSPKLTIDDKYASGWEPDTIVNYQAYGKSLTGPIKNIPIGASVNGDIIIGKVFQYSPVRYLWKDLIVSGNQIVQTDIEKGDYRKEHHCDIVQWNRIMNLSLAKKIGPGILCCLATNTGKIQIDGEVFKDYWEVPSRYWDQWEKKMEQCN